jgi:hypothetical protein
MTTKTLFCVLAVIMLLLTGKGLCVLGVIRNNIINEKDVNIILDSVNYLELLMYSFSILSLAFVAPVLRKKIVD